MKTKLLLIAALAVNITASASRLFPQRLDTQKDSIVVTFGDKTRLVIYGEDRRELENVMQYDLNALLKDLKIRLDSSRSDTTYLFEEFNGRNYLKNNAETTEKDYVKIGLRGIHIKDGDTRVSISSKGVEVRDDETVVTTDSAYKKSGKRFYRSGFGSSPRKGFNIALGLNTYGSNDPMGYVKDEYDLRPFGSRYVSLGYVVSAKVVDGKHTRLHLDLGLDFSWYNLMFDGNNTVSKDDEKVIFTDVRNEAEQLIEVKKSKLTVPYVNLSLMPTLTFSRSFISYVSAGIYGGYRLGSYTKVREEGSKDVDHDRRNFFIEDLRYGLTAELGIRNFPDFFVNYDLNTLYRDGRGPAVKMISFGIRLF